MKLLLVSLTLILTACSGKNKQNDTKAPIEVTQDLRAVLDTIRRTEQRPIQLRDSLIEIYGAESKEIQEQQSIYKKNHIINEKKIRTILDNHGWPKKEHLGELGNLTICNVIQHADNAIRIKYLPLMRQAVMDKKLEARFLVRAEDRIATESGDLQIYGGQMKYYPETKSFNVWPVYDPTNIDNRRAEIGLGPINEHLKNRFNFEWNLEEQLQRTAKFEKEINKNQ
jgi:hypothetical protein